MDPQRAFTLGLTGLLLGALIAGLLFTRRYRLCRSFLVYAAAVFLGDRLIAGWPARFDTAPFWWFKESVYWALKLAVAGEIGLLTFSQLPRARRLLVGLVAILAAGAVLSQLAPASAKPGDAIAWVSVVGPRGQASILVVFAAVLSLAAYYRVPVHPFHRSVLLGFGLYLVAYTGALTLLREWGAPGYRIFLAMDPTAYAATVGVWAWAAWRRQPAPTSGARVLQPWAASAS